LKVLPARSKNERRVLFMSKVFSCTLCLKAEQDIRFNGNCNYFTRNCTKALQKFQNLSKKAQETIPIQALELHLHLRKILVVEYFID